MSEVPLCMYLSNDGYFYAGPTGSPRAGDTSLIRNSNPLGPYSRTMPRVLWWS